VSTIRLDSWRAWRQSWVSLSQHPWPLLGFSGAVLALHLLGWALFAVAEGQESAVLSALLHLLGLGLYSASLLWMVEGLSRGGLAIARQQPFVGKPFGVGGGAVAGGCCAVSPLWLPPRPWRR